MDRYTIKDFEQYKRQGEPGRLEKSRLWETAIGLQQVDGLTPSKYLIETAKEQIEGDITFQEAQARIHSYYRAKPSQNVGEMETEEADKVSAKIAEILADKSFTFSPIELQNIHKKLFDGIFSFAGDIRDYNITKDEWFLGGDTVYYASFESIIPTLQYDFNEEKAFNYKGLSKQQSVEHIAKFISGIWQIHPFGEGNTRTTAVFAIKYLRTLGFNVNNKLFAEHSWYFRNALVRASYNNVNCEAYSSDIFLIEFFENLLIGAKHALRNRNLLIKSDTVNDTVKANFDTVKLLGDTVIDLIKINNKITANEIAEKLKISLSTVKREIKKLKNSGEIERVGSDKKGQWNVLQN